MADVPEDPNLIRVVKRADDRHGGADETDGGDRACGSRGRDGGRPVEVGRSRRAKPTVVARRLRDLSIAAAGADDSPLEGGRS
jgi:hypothetical protein